MGIGFPDLWHQPLTCVYFLPCIYYVHGIGTALHARLFNSGHGPFSLKTVRIPFLSAWSVCQKSILIIPTVISLIFDWNQEKTDICCLCTIIVRIRTLGDSDILIRLLCSIFLIGAGNFKCACIEPANFTMSV